MLHWLKSAVRKWQGPSPDLHLRQDELHPGEMVPGNVTLVIVHMMRWYGHSIDEAQLQSVRDLIDLAKSRNWAIVMSWQAFPEEFGIYPELTEAVQGYGSFRDCHAPDTDGSRQVKRVCDRKRSRHFIVVGVYAGACVRATVEGLLRRCRRSTVRVIKEACRDHFSDRGTHWEHYPVHPRLALSSETVLSPLKPTKMNPKGQD